MRKIKARNLVIGKKYITDLESVFKVTALVESSITKENLKMSYTIGSSKGEVMVGADHEFNELPFKFGK